MGEVLAAELGAQADFLGFLQEFFLQVDVAERPAGLIAGGGQGVVILDAGEFDREEVPVSVYGDKAGESIVISGRKSFRLTVVPDAGYRLKNPPWKSTAGR